MPRLGTSRLGHDRLGAHRVGDHDHAEWVIAPGESATVARATASRTHAAASGLSLTFACAPPAREVLRVLADQTAKIRRTDRAAGSFVAADASFSGATVELRPPLDRRPPFRRETVLVRGYDEARGSRARVRENVALDTDYQSSREPDGNAPTETRSSDQWSLGFANGTLALDAADVEQATAGELQRLSTTVTATQLTALLDSPGYPAGATVRAVPGGDDYVVDESEGDRQTVTVTPPDDRQGDPGYPEGDFVILGWEASRVAPTRYRVRLDIRATP